MSAQSIAQSGNVTPGHIATWVTDGVLNDGGLIAIGPPPLASLRSADFNSTADQAIYIPYQITACQITGIIITNTTRSLTTSVGGFYPTVSKGGVAIVANSQVYSTLTAAAKLLSATIAAAALATRYSSANMDVTTISGYNYLTLYLSLTTPQGLASLCDVYILGNNLS